LPCADICQAFSLQYFTAKLDIFVAMKFRTEIEPVPLAQKIDHSRRGLAIGSCFAEAVAGRMRRAKLPVACNPEGVLYNPLSIAEALESGTSYASLNLRQTENERAGADYIIVTFGTAWVYEEGGRVVANCGKRPAHLFTRRRLSVGEIVERFEGLFGGVLRGKQVIFTVSPIRHLKDGFEENSLSKATLRLAIAEIVARHPETTHYFPAFEILNDDLRDYRFYAADLTHPSAQAVDYIWEKFAGAALSPQTAKLVTQIENIARAAEHRPFNPETTEHQDFRRAMLHSAQELQRQHPEADLSAEIAFFRQD
jgi:hypothetical protein